MINYLDYFSKFYLLLVVVVLKVFLDVCFFFLNAIVALQ